MAEAIFLVNFSIWVDQERCLSICTPKAKDSTVSILYREGYTLSKYSIFYAQIETESLCSHCLYCVQNFKTTVPFVNIKQNSH